MNLKLGVSSSSCSDSAQILLLDPETGGEETIDVILHKPKRRELAFLGDFSLKIKWRANQSTEGGREDRGPAQLGHVVVHTLHPDQCVGTL